MPNFKPRNSKTAMTRERWTVFDKDCKILTIKNHIIKIIIMQFFSFLECLKFPLKIVQ